jgi:endoglycosylceramidase
VAGYDLLNEPNPGMTPGVNDYALLGVFYGRAITAIRSVDTTHAVFFEPAVITGPLPTPGPLVVPTADQNLVYAPHLYNESISILPGTIENGFANAKTAASTYGTPYFSGEWGWFGNNAADQPFIERYARNEDANLIGGTWWQWQQACGDPHAVGTRHHRPSCAGKSPYSDGLVIRSAANRSVLTRAYPRAAPGVLTSIDATVATGALVITGIADRTGAAADLWVPSPCAAPTVTGANVASWTVRDVAGGHRVSATVATPGAYRIAIACLAAATTPAVAAPNGTNGTTGTTPATGADATAPLSVAAIAVVAVAVRRRYSLGLTPSASTTCCVFS